MGKGNADSVPQGTLKTAVDCGKETFGIFAHPNPVCKLPTDRGCIRGQGNPLRTGHPRLRPAVTHDYSEVVTAHPLSQTETRACGGPVLSGVATPEEQVSKEQLGELGPRAQGGRIQKWEQDTGNSWDTGGMPGSQTAKHRQGMVRERPHVATVAPNLPPPVSSSISRAKRL